MPRILTGITTSGTPHLGNYVGAIRPAIAASHAPGVESFYFLADYHALIKVADPARVQRSTLEIAAAWLACGLDPDKVVEEYGKIMTDDLRRENMKEQTNIFRVLVKTLLNAGIITDRTKAFYAMYVDIDELRGEGDRMVGDDIAEEGIVYLKAINFRDRAPALRLAAAE